MKRPRPAGGNDTLITALVVGTAEHGATVHGDHGDDKITTGAVQGGERGADRAAALPHGVDRGVIRPMPRPVALSTMDPDMGMKARPVLAGLYPRVCCR
ncbi:hypothetical protein ACFWY6_09965 [Streptomyces sp. NPDC059037]|uniref:hypothetical protein n=1 Tax=Streptomyces sp. NPDC059037 TaxID=3346710 RepID=UPI0036AC863C